MKFEALMRAESIVTKQSILELQEIIQTITEQMEEDGFELSDVKDFIQVQLDEVLGK